MSSYTLKREILAVLARKLYECPDLRVCQLIVNATSQVFGSDPFYCTDVQLLEALREYNP